MPSKRPVFTKASDRIRLAIESAVKEGAMLPGDARLLVDGGWRLDWVQPVDQFLWSPHVEAVATLSKNKT